MIRTLKRASVLVVLGAPIGALADSDQSILTMETLVEQGAQISQIGSLQGYPVFVLTSEIELLGGSVFLCRTDFDDFSDFADYRTEGPTGNISTICSIMN